MKQLLHRAQSNGARGFTLFELLVVCALVALLAVFALERFRSVQEDAEEVMAEQVLGTLKNATRIRATELISGRRWDELRRMVGGNPFDWLEELPENYDGKLTGEGRPGRWYFDSARGAVVYFVRHAERFESSGGSPSMRFAVVGLDSVGNPLTDEPFSWVGVRPDARYVWNERAMQ